MLLCDHYITARSLDEAFDAMDAHRGRYRIVAGATDTLPWAREGRAGDVHIPALIDIGAIPELNQRRVAAGRVQIGAAMPIQRFLDDDALLRAMPAAPHCAVWFADDQIRELATVGGNIVNASPAADATPCLIAHDAVVELASRRDGEIVRRTEKLASFVRGPGQTGLADGEILVSVSCDALPGYGGTFEKVGHRRSLVISVVCLTVLVKLDVGGRVIEDARLAIAGVRPVPCRIDAVETALRGARLSMETVENVAAMPLDLVQSRSRQDYRRDVIRGFLARGLISAAKRAGADPQAFQHREAAYA
jgi:CO/xanthine dehydrogenase FAD-binding subunit